MTDKITKYFNFALLILLTALVAQYGYYLINDACFTFGDEFYFIDFFRYKKIPIQNVGGECRFCPLGFQEYWPYVLINATIDTKIILLKIHTFIKLILLLICIWLAVRKLSNKICATSACLFVLVATHALLYSYSQSQSQESSVMTLWALWFYCFVSAQKSDNSGFFIFAVIFATLAIYMKETAFILFFPISVVFFVFNFNKATTKEKVYHLTIVLQVMLFFLLYFYYLGCNSSYNEGRYLLSISDMALFYANETAVKISTVIALVRLTYWAIRRRIDISVADTLLFSSILFVCAYIILKLAWTHYILPAIVIQHTTIFLYLYQLWESKMLEKIKTRFQKLTMIALGIIISLISCHVLQEYKNMILPEMHNIAIRYQTMKNLLNKMNILKKERYITIGYLPKIEYFDRPLYFYENAFALMILHKYVGCFVENHYLSLSFIDNKSEYDINDNGYFFVFTELKALKTALMKYQKSGSKIAIVIPASDENYAGGNYASHLSTLGWFQTKIPHFYIYTSKAIDCWSDFSKNGIIDVTNPPLSVSIMGLAQSEIWGRWSDGKQVLMTFELPKHLRGRKLTLKIPLIHVINGKQRILPILNGEALSEINVSEPRTIDINIGAKFSSSGKISLTLNLPDAVASKDISNNPDTRILGIGFKEIMIAESNPDDI